MCLCSFDDDYGEQQARTEALEWGGQLMTALAGLHLSLGDAKAKGRPGDRRIEVELVRSERRARDVKRWLVDNKYFSERNRVGYILQKSDTSHRQEEIVVVEGLLANGHVGVITVFRRDDNGREFRSTAELRRTSTRRRPWKVQIADNKTLEWGNSNFPR